MMHCYNCVMALFILGQRRPRHMVYVSHRMSLQRIATRLSETMMIFSHLLLNVPALLLKQGGIHRLTQQWVRKTLRILLKGFQVRSFSWDRVVMGKRTMMMQQIVVVVGNVVGVFRLTYAFIILSSIWMRK